MTEHPERRHILFVDDEAASQRIVERMLRAGVPGARVSCASDGAQALEILERERVDLLISDLTMPGMDGIELLRQVSNRRLVLPVIVVTGHGSPVDETRALSGGALEYFEKPIDAGPFLKSVNELLEGSEQRSRIQGLSIAGFVQLLNMERKTCALRASVPGAQGVLFFNAGALVDARQAELSGTEAALEIFTWKEPIITLEAQSRGRATTIQMGVMELLLESARVADERERNARRRTTQARTTVRTEAVPVPVAAAAGVGKAAALSLVPPVGSTRRPTPVPVPAPQTAPWEQPEAQVEVARLLAEVMRLDGAVAAAVAHWELDHTLGALGERDLPQLDVAVSGNCRVVRALMTNMERLGLRGKLQDVMITLDDQMHILWPLPRHEGLFLYLAVDRARGNPALTRHKLQKIVDAPAE